MEPKTRILDSAVRLFSENGIKSVRMDDIAIHCGISKRTLYEIFNDREDLIRQSVEYSFHLFNNMVEEKTKGIDNIIEETWIALNCAAEFRKFTKPVMNDIIRFYPTIMADLLDSHHSNILEYNKIRHHKGIEQGLFEEMINIEVVNNVLTNYFYGLKRDLCITGFMGEEDTEIKSLKFLVIIFLRGMATDKGRRYIDENILPHLG